jgi:tetratricopeptide (TPR) repeat protein
LLTDLFDRVSRALSNMLGVDSGTAQILSVLLAAVLAWFLGGHAVGSLLPRRRSASGGGSGERLRRGRRQAKKALAQGDAGTAAKHLEMAGDHEGARKLREKAALSAQDSGQWATAASHLEALGRHGEAGRLLVKAKRHADAAVAFREAGKPSEAARAMELGGKLVEAARCFIEHGRMDDALRCLERACASSADEEYRLQREELALQAARIARKLGRPGRAAGLLEIAGQKAAAARMHAAAGNHARAAEFFEATGEWGEAAESHAKAGETEGARRCGALAATERGDDLKAGELHAEGEDWRRAAESFARAKQAERAANCFERIGAWACAAEWHGRNGDAERAADCHERAGEHWDAARLLHELGETERALENYAAVGSHDEHFLLARGHSGALHSQRGEHAAALTLLEQVVAKLGHAAVASAWMPDWLDALALAQEADGDEEASLESLKQLALLQPTRPGLTERIENLSQRSKPGRSDRDLTPDRYQVLQELAAGGMGRVYLARDVALERFVALKVLSDTWRDHRELRERFLREARVAAKLSHPNVVAVHDVGDDDGRPYMALEYVEGRDLSSLLKERGKLTSGEALPILLAVAQALEAAHELGIVHRDVKPGNVFLRKDGAIKLGDFGIARLEGLDLTETGIAVGTPRYMAPEQACGQSVDGRADVYALGVMTYRLLTGRPPFVGGDLAYQHVHATPPDPREFEPGIPPMLAQLILSCLAKKPSSRPPTAARFAELLEAACQLQPV